jgi:hypothetical protein
MKFALNRLDMTAAGARLEHAAPVPVCMVLPHPIIPRDEPIDFISDCARHLLPTFS